MLLPIFSEYAIPLQCNLNLSTFLFNIFKKPYSFLQHSLEVQLSITVKFP